MPFTFLEYLENEYDSKNGTIKSYLKALDIIDSIFRKKDIFHLNGKSVTEIHNPILLARIADYIIFEEYKFKNGEHSIFDLGLPTQTSYPKKGFCRAAMRKLESYLHEICYIEATDLMAKGDNSGLNLSTKLLKTFDLKNHLGETEMETTTKARLGQGIFRKMLLKLYGSKCCLSGIDVPEVLRASHIIPWAERENTRLNPENGLCLSATYDAAFDKYLISFDEDFRLILSPKLRNSYNSQALKQQFLNLEGKKISLPEIYLPSQEFLSIHRKKLIS